MKRINAVQRSIAKGITLLILLATSLALLSCRAGRLQAGESDTAALRQGFSQPPRHAGV